MLPVPGTAGLAWRTLAVALGLVFALPAVATAQSVPFPVSIQGPSSPPVEVHEYTSVSHVWPDDGDYTVTLTVRDERGELTSATHDIEVRNRGPRISRSAAVEVDPSARIVELTASAQEAEGDTLFYRWDFGDGEGAEGPLGTFGAGGLGGLVEALTGGIADLLPAADRARMVDSLGLDPSAPERVDDEAQPLPARSPFGLEDREGFKSAGGSLELTFVPGQHATGTYDVTLQNTSSDPPAGLETVHMRGSFALDLGAARRESLGRYDGCGPAELEIIGHNPYPRGARQGGVM